jgi:thioredoxin reductase
MGCNARTDVLGLKVERDDDGMVRTDKHQRTSIRHLYAAGDIVNTLNQISVASGEAAQNPSDAATAAVCYRRANRVRTRRLPLVAQRVHCHANPPA